MMTPPLSIWAIPLLTLKVPVDCPFSAIKFSPWVSTRICKGYLTTGNPLRQTGEGLGTSLVREPTRDLLPLLPAFSGVFLGEFFEERPRSVGRRPFGRGKGQGELAAGEITRLLNGAPSDPVSPGVLAASEARHYSISMRSRLAEPADSCCPCGLTSSPRPLSVSKPAFLKCLAALVRRSPGTST